MARLPNTATKEERRELHKAKMAGRKYDREQMALNPLVHIHQFNARNRNIKWDV